MRLIDADYLKEIIETYRPILITSDYLQGKNNMVDYCIAEIDSAPTINPSFNLDNITEEEIEKFKIIWQRANSKGLLAINEERPQGEWIEKQETPVSISYYCSNCEHIGLGFENFCAWCGADMRGKE